MADQGYDPFLRAMYAASEWQQAAEQAQRLQAMQALLAQRPVVGANIHEAPQGLRPSYIAEQAIEPVAFGAFEDPISQLAFLGAPSMVRLGKAALEAAATPGPRFGGLISERGNLGRPPMGPRGEALPGSVVRDEQGNLRRLFHGTPSQFPDFEMAKMSPEGLYGPGIYMTESPDIARGYALQNWPDEAKDAFRSLETAQGMRAYQEGQAASARSLEDATYYLQQAEQIKPLEAQAMARLNAQFERAPWMFRDPANIRPTYADLKKPFDLNAPMSEQEATRLLGAAPGASTESITNMLGGYMRGRLGGARSLHMTGEDLYQVLSVRGFGGDKAATNQFLQAQGYDGITHIGGGNTGNVPHQVYIAFSPEQVYPSFNVDALRQSLGGP
jgi:ADP-Ribosyltransferase in polyvalent proteins